jgi:nitrogen-specific signal transduction histidine kinase
VQALLPLLSSALGSGVVLQTSVDSDLPRVRVNRAQLEGTIANLVIDARDALAGTPGAKVTVKASLVMLDDAAAANRGLALGAYVALCVRDNRAETSEALRDSVTNTATKSDGKRGGLGLSMARRLAENSGGAAWLLGRRGRGICVAVFLPTCDSGRSAGTAVSNPQCSGTQIHR